MGSELVLLKRTRNGSFEAPVPLASYEGKAEGVAAHGDRVIVIFDSDQDRKDKADPAKFPLEIYEDYYHVARY